MKLGYPYERRKWRPAAFPIIRRTCIRYAANGILRPVLRPSFGIFLRLQGHAAAALRTCAGRGILLFLAIALHRFRRGRLQGFSLPYRPNQCFPIPPAPFARVFFLDALSRYHQYKANGIYLQIFFEKPVSCIAGPSRRKRIGQTAGRLRPINGLIGYSLYEIVSRIPLLNSLFGLKKRKPHKAPAI